MEDKEKEIWEKRKENDLHPLYNKSIFTGWQANRPSAEFGGFHLCRSAGELAALQTIRPSFPLVTGALFFFEGRRIPIEGISPAGSDDSASKPNSFR